MKSVQMSSHDFDKVNLVTLSKGGDQYRCAVCGCTGIRISIEPIVTLSEKEYNKSIKCDFKKLSELRKLPVKVLLDDMPYVGIRCGVYNVEPSPIDDYKDDVWVFSESRNELVRVLPYEIIDQEYA